MPDLHEDEPDRDDTDRASAVGAAPRRPVLPSTEAPTPRPTGPPEVEALHLIDEVIGNREHLGPKSLGKVRGVVLDTLNRWHRRQQERRRLVVEGRPSPLPSEVLESCDGGRGIGAFVLSVEVLDRLPILMRDEVPPGGFLPEAEADRLRGQLDRAHARLGEFARTAERLRNERDDARRQLVEQGQAGEVDRADEAEERLASMTGRRNRARDHAVRNESEAERLRGQLASVIAERDEARRMVAAEQARLGEQVDMLRAQLAGREAVVARLTAERDDARRQLVEHARDAEQNAQGFRGEVARLTSLLDERTGELRASRELLDDASREAERADAAISTLATYRREVEEQTARAEQEHATRLRNEHLLDAAEQKAQKFRAARAEANRRLDEEYVRAEQAEEQADTLRGEVARLTSLLDDASREAGRADAAEARVMELERNLRRCADDLGRFGELKHSLGPEGSGLLVVPKGLLPTPEHPAALRVYGPGLVEYDGRELRVTYEPASAADAIVAEHDARQEASPHPIEEDPRRPHLDSYPEDAILLTYREVRQLLGLHIEAVGDSVLSARDQARAMRDGETPLRLAEVLDR
jgi:hypothetical protein